MPFLFITFILLIISIMLYVVSSIEDKWKKTKKITGAISIITFLSTIIQFLLLEVPAPEIFTRNQDLEAENSVYFTAEWPLEVWYTTIPYEDPQSNGIKFEKDIPLEQSMTVSAKACFLGLKWSELTWRDITIGKDNQATIIQTDKPGSSIKEISADLKVKKLFPGDILTRDELEVNGITISGEKIPISDYDFVSQKIVEGENEIVIKYKDFECSISYFSEKAKLKELNAKYVGEEITEGNDILKEQFEVIGVYEDGKEERITDFEIEPSTAKKAGTLTVKISKENVSTTVKINVKEAPELFAQAFETHQPNDIATSVKFLSGSGQGFKDLKKTTYESGLFLFISNMFNGLGSGLANEVTSDIHLPINSDCINRDEFLGDIIVENGSAGTEGYAYISILVDGEVVWETKEAITGTTVEPVPFKIDVSQAESEVIIRTKCIPKQSGLGIGIVNMEYTYKEN